MGIRQGPILLLQFREQPHVLDRDDRLVGEGLEERDFVVVESTGLAAGDRDRSDRGIAEQHRHHQDALVATNTGVHAPGF
jgi:hypothetical protein